jgi:hypothetical protein
MSWNARSVGIGARTLESPAFNYERDLILACPADQ